MREKNPSMEFANKTALAYSAVCKPLCQELGLPQTAFDHSLPKGKLTRMTRWLSKHQRLRFMRHNNLPIRNSRVR